MSTLDLSRRESQLPGTRPKSVEQLRCALRARLQERASEIEQAVATRVFAVSGSSEADDPEYVQGLRTATAAALAYGLEAIEHGERSRPLPGVLLEQARQAARYGIGLDTVLRRYFAGYTLLGDFIAEEAQRAGRSAPGALREVQRAQAALFDRLIAAVAEAHTSESGERAPTQERRRAECVKRLLDGELVNTTALSYELDGWHLGLVVEGPGAARAARDLARAADRNLLMAPQAESTVWAWLGGRRAPDPAEMMSTAGAMGREGIIVALGEPGQALAGWRLTHRQARAASSVALRGHEPCIRYADVALLSSALRDDLLSTSLHQLYLAPLEQHRDGGTLARQALRAYFAAERNVSSAATTLGISRQALARRLRSVEEVLGLSLGKRGAELEIALNIAEVGDK